KKARNSYFHSIRKAKQEKWTEFLENSHGKDIFQVLRYTKPRRNQATPVLLDNDQNQYSSFEQKCSLFRSSVFPPPPQHTGGNPQPPHRILQWPDITSSEIIEAIHTPHPNKAP